MTEANNAARSLSDLPEGCLFDILSRNSPGDACRVASISKGFKSMTDSDALWERLLPPGYNEVIERAFSPVVFDSKKQLYNLLSDSYILLDHGNLGLKLEKESGKKCYMLGARGLSIAWGDDTRYWNWEHVPHSRFAEVAILTCVWWLDINGTIESATLSPKTTYVAYLVYRIIGDSRGLTTPGSTIVNFGGIRNETPNVFLQQHTEPAQLQAHEQAPATRSDGWMEIKLGEIYYDHGDEGRVHMSFQEHSDYNYKRGLVVEGIELRPR